MPPKNHTKPFVISNETYHHLFDTPVRILNAVNMEDPADIISVGMIWCTEEEFQKGLEQAAQSEHNKIREDRISEVVEHISIKIYKVKEDTNLGN